VFHAYEGIVSAQPVETFRIAFNVVDRKVGCVLVQAAARSTVPSGLFNRLFPSETWDVGSEHLKVYLATREQLYKLATIARDAAKARTA